MSGWSLISFDPIRVEDLPEDLRRDGDGNYRWPSDEIQRICVEEFDAWTDRTHSVYASFGGYRDWGEDGKVLEETKDWWKKAAVVHANDTSDTGTARVYAKKNGTITKIDEYSESQTEDGTRVGQKAAAYVSFYYDFTARASHTEAGRGWDYTRAVDWDYVYTVQMKPLEFPKDVDESTYGTDHPLNNHRAEDHAHHHDVAFDGVSIRVSAHPTEEEAVEAGKIAKEEFERPVWIRRFPVQMSWYGGIKQEYEHPKFPSYGKPDDYNEYIRKI